MSNIRQNLFFAFVYNVLGVPVAADLDGNGGNDVEEKRKGDAERMRPWLIATLALSLLLGCAAAKELAAIRQVQFHLNGVGEARLAGVSLESVRSYSDLRPTDLARLGLAIANKDVPLEVTLEVEGRNPETNTVTAKLVAMDWTCLVDDREVVSGQLREPISFAPGRARLIPLPVRVNLVELFGDRRQDLIDVALALAGRNTSRHAAALRIVPTVDTALGPIRYPAPITLTISSPEAR